MARIAVWLTPVAGPINASRRLVKDLRARGHTVVYMGAPRCEPYVEGGPVPFVTVFAEWLPPRDDVDPNASAPPAGRPRGPNPAKAFFKALMSGEATSFEAALTAWRIDLLLLPSCFRLSTTCGLLAHRVGVPSMYVTSIFLRSEDHSAAPVGSDYSPSPTLASAVRITARWWWGRVVARGMHAAFRVIHGLTPDGVVRTLATRVGYPQSLIESRDLFAPRMAAPEIVLYPECLDLPGGQRPGRVYGSASIDLNRAEPEFPTHRLNGPLIFCAMGTMADGYTSRARLRQFYQAVIDACAEIRPRHQLVIAVDPCDEREFRYDADRAIVVKRAPQLALLQRASLMITHGGPNSVKECAYFGVPVVVFPLGFDQPATAARVRFHGLGRVGAFKRATATTIRGLVDEVLHTPFFRIQAAAMQRRMRQADLTRPELDAIAVTLDAAAAWRRLHSPGPGDVPDAVQDRPVLFTE